MLFLDKPRGRGTVQFVEFVCPECLAGGYSPTDADTPRCRHCAISMWPDDLTIPDYTPQPRERPAPPRYAHLDDDDVQDRFRDLVSQGLNDDEIWNVVKLEFDFDLDDLSRD